jgi:hypothetical protein
MFTEESMKKIVGIYLITVIAGIITAVLSASYLFKNAIDVYAMGKTNDMHLHQINYSIFIEDALKNIELAQSNSIDEIIEESCNSIKIAVHSIESFGTESGYVFEQQLTDSVAHAKLKLESLKGTGYCTGE